MAGLRRSARAGHPRGASRAFARLATDLRGHASRGRGGDPCPRQGRELAASDGQGPMTRRGRLSLALALLGAVVLGAVVYKSAPRLTPWATAPSSRWPDEFSVVELESSADGSKQKAIFRAARGPSRPLIVSLHPWAGDYESADPLASPVGKE